jgi:hypothetical protein
MLEHLGVRWGYVFLRTTSHVPMDDLQALMRLAVETHLQGEELRLVRGDTFAGRRYTEQRYEMMGDFGGQRFAADLESTPSLLPGQQADRWHGLRHVQKQALRQNPLTSGESLPYHQRHHPDTLVPMQLSRRDVPKWRHGSGRPGSGVRDACKGVWSPRIG